MDLEEEFMRGRGLPSTPWTQLNTQALVALKLMLEEQYKAVTADRTVYKVMSTVLAMYELDVAEDVTTYLEARGIFAQGLSEAIRDVTQELLTRPDYSYEEAKQAHRLEDERRMQGRGPIPPYTRENYPNLYDTYKNYGDI